MGCKAMQSLKSILHPVSKMIDIQNKLLEGETWFQLLTRHCPRRNCREMQMSPNARGDPFYGEIPYTCIIFCLDYGNDHEQATKAKDCFSRSCRVILLKHAKERDDTINPTVTFGVLFGWTNVKMLPSLHRHHIV